MTIARVFVPNRGEIAVRILRTCRELGVETVLGVSAADREGLATELADRVVVLGPAPSAASYLRVDTIVHAALATGCDALHPGYGFLSENAELARLTAEEGVRFVGPPAAVIELAGDKLRAREAARDAGIPVVPGSAITSLAAAEAFAADVGYPVLLKAAGGGGGRGIKRAEDAGDLRSLYGVAQAEAGAAFGDDRLYIERYVRRARHVEVQVAGDAHGALVHLGERDCSTQRRYQKLIEEAPAPALEDDLRAGLHDAALTFARAIGYVNLGTVEFVVDVERGDLCFLEMNCRIQVEHPVTEAVCGLDLVALQLRLADGLPLGIAQGDVCILGHAVECRLVAEDPAHDFRPSPGRIERFHVPDLPGLRVDTHCRPGTLVPPYYDSLLAKLIAHAPDRSSALELLGTALDGLEVTGISTNRQLLAELVRHERLRSGDITTRWLEEALAP
jgi:acetyl-CoA carboxylase biotin carboxylase subunit